LAWKRQEHKLEREDDHYAFEQSAKIIARINAQEEAKEIAIFNVNKEYANHHLKCKVSPFLLSLVDMTKLVVKLILMMTLSSRYCIKALTL
jgi:hypothetical protein